MSINARQPTDDIDERTRSLVGQQHLILQRRNSRLFAGLLLAEYIAGVVIALFFSPRTWWGLDSYVHPHVITALTLGFAIVSLPVAMALRWPAYALTHHVIAAGQMLMAGLLIHLTGGRVETHFLIFGSLAFLAFYRDWRILVTASLVTGLDHWARGMWWPQSIYGELWISPWRWIEHVWWVAFEDVFLIIACVRGQKDITAQCRRQADLEVANQLVEERASTLALNEQRYHFMADNMPQMVWTTNAAGQQDYGNQRWHAYTGLSQAAFSGSGWLRVIHPDDVDRCNTLWNTALASDKPFEIEYRMRRASDGAFRWHLARAMAMRDDDGNVLQWVGTCTDIDDARRTQAELRQAHEMLEHRVANRTGELQRVNEQMSRTQSTLTTVLNSSLVGVSVYESIRDPSGAIVDFRYVMINAAAEGLLNKTQEEIVGQTLLGLFPGVAVDGLFAKYAKVVETGQAIRHEHYYLHDGITAWFEESIAKFGESDGFVVTFADVTARKLAEQQIHQAKEAAESATRSKTDFLANMSHEIRTPITAIVGFADMMLDPGQSKSDWHDNLQTIRRNARHLLELINDILDISKIEADRMSVERIECDLSALLADVLSLMNARAGEKGLALTMTFASAIPRTMVTDPLRLKQILMNLISNAVKFSHAGTIELQAEHQQVDHGGLLCFRVIDSGIGMTEKQIAGLFQPFTQADSSTTRKYGGTGLGLTISRRLARLLGGDISAQSDYGHGSTFEVTVEAELPADVSWMTNIDDATAARETDGRTDEPVRLSGRILLAEDGRDNQRFISAMLRQAGAEVVIAENGRIAVERVEAERFDMVFMDMQMPEMDGYQAASFLRAKGYTLPIVALTAHAMSDDRTKCLQAGCSDYLTKPIDRQLLVRTAAQQMLKAAGGSPGQIEKRANPVSALQQGAGPTEPLCSSLVDDEVMRDVLVEFVANLSHEVFTMQQAMARGELDSLRVVVHQLKGAGGSFGFQGITDLARATEASIHAASAVEQVRSEVESLIALVRRVDGYNGAAEVSHAR